MSVKIRMLTLAAGPAGVFPAGAIRNVTDDEALALVDGGYAEFVATEPTAEKPVEKPVEDEIETAMAATPETTARRTVKPKGRGRR